MKVEKTRVRDTKPQDIVHIRLPVGLKDKFKEKCWQSRTSMNRKLVQFIERYIQ